MYSMDDDKLGKYRNQVKKRSTCRFMCLVTILLVVAFGFALTSSESKLVTTAAKYHPQVLSIHRKLHKVAHGHLTRVHHHLNKAHWPKTPNKVASKLRGSAASHLIHLSHMNHRHANHEENLNSLSGKEMIRQEESTINEATTNISDSKATEQTQQMTEEASHNVVVQDEPPALE